MLNSFGSKKNTKIMGLGPMLDLESIRFFSICNTAKVTWTVFALFAENLTLHPLLEIAKSTREPFKNFSWKPSLDLFIRKK